MKEPSFMNQLLGFLEKPAPLHPLRSNLVCRVIGFLLDKKNTEMLQLMQQKENLVDRFLDHLDNASVVDLLQKVVGSDPVNSPADTSFFNWLKESQLISKLTCKLDPALDAETHHNASGALVEMARVPAMAQVLETEECVTKMLTYILSNDTPQPLAPNSALISGLNVVIELVKHFNQSHKFTTKEEMPLDKMPIVYSLLLGNLDKFITVLKAPSNQRISTTMGEIEPVGFARLKILDLIFSLVNSNYQCVDEVLMEKDVFSVCLDLFFHFKWNNSLHTTVQHIIEVALKVNEDVKEHLIVKSKLTQRIAEADQQANGELANDPRSVRPGYMGHIIHIAKEIRSQTANSIVLKTVLEEDKSWIAFCEGTLKERLTIESSILGGRPTHRESSSSGEEEEEDMDGHEDNTFDNDADELAFGDSDDHFRDPSHDSNSSSDENSEDDEAHIIDQEEPPQSPEHAHA